jgi:hypothetical protein
MDNLLAPDTKSKSLDDAREYIKALATVVKSFPFNTIRKIERRHCNQPTDLI